MRIPVPLRWIAVTIFFLSSILNYLDRSILGTLVDIWKTRPEFPFTVADYGTTLAVFGIAYAVAAPLMGLFIDRVGLNKGIAISVGLWSLASLAHGFVRGAGDLLICRAFLGAVEAGGISANGKANGMYLRPKERAVGLAISQLGLSVGAAVAPWFTIYFAYNHNWRWAFYGAGIVGLLWIPLWLFTAKTIPPGDQPVRARVSSTVLLRDPRLWAMMSANALGMTFYWLWTNFNQIYLVRVHHLTPPEAARYSWVVPIAGYLGALAGGSMSWRLIARGMDPVRARLRVCFLCAVILLLSALIPFSPTPLITALGMSLSYFWITASSTNLYTMPVDLYGADRAAFAVSGLVFSYGAMQALVSQPLGRMIQNQGFQPAMLMVFALLPMLGYGILRAFLTTLAAPSPLVHAHQ